MTVLQLYIHSLKLYPIAGIVIGFLQTKYILDEAVGTVVLEVGVVSGNLYSDVVIRLDTLDGSARGMYVRA